MVFHSMFQAKRKFSTFSTINEFGPRGVTHSILVTKLDIILCKPTAERTVHNEVQHKPIRIPQRSWHRPEGHFGTLNNAGFVRHLHADSRR